MSVDTTTGTFISLLQAKEMIGRWTMLQTAQGLVVDPSNPKAIAFGRDKILEILGQTDCVGVRIYNGVESGNKNMIFVGIDAAGNDQVSGLILDVGRPCPSECAAISIEE